MLVLRSIAEHSDIRNMIKRLDPIKAVSVFAGLCCNLELHSNFYCLDKIIQLLLGYCDGKSNISISQTKKIFEKIGCSFSHLQDPAEDVLVGIINFEYSDYKILEGGWEINSFYTQRFVNILMKNEDPFCRSLEKSILALLKLSDKMIERSGLTRYCVGNKQQILKLNKKIFQNFSSIDKFCHFSKDDLIALNINPTELEHFVFPYCDREALLDENSDESILYNKPLIYNGETYYLIYPNAIGTAIRNLYIEYRINCASVSPAIRELAYEYIDLFSGKRLFIDVTCPCDFDYFYKDDKSGLHAFDCALGNDRAAKYIYHFLFIVPSYHIFNGNWNAPVIGDSSNTMNIIKNRISYIDKEISKQTKLQAGMTIIVLCGWGGTFVGSLPVLENKKWGITFLNAADLITLSRQTIMSSVHFWHFVENERILRDAGVQVINLDGLLNMYAFCKNNDYSLIPKSEKGCSDPVLTMLLYMDSSFQLSLREDIANSYDLHNIRDIDGISHSLQRLNTDSYFKEESNLPIYVSVTDAVSGHLTSVIKHNDIKLWCKHINNPTDNKSFVFEIWKAVCNWSYKLLVAIVDDYHFGYKDDIIILVKFENPREPIKNSSPLSVSDLTKMINIYGDISDNHFTITCEISGDFISGFNQADNNAERSIMSSILTAIKDQFDLQEINTEDFINRIFHDHYAKYVHSLNAEGYLDYIADNLSEGIYVDPICNTNTRIAIDWDIRQKSCASQINGTTNCTEYLNRVVDGIYSRLKKILSELNKKETILLLLRNIQSIGSSRIRWERTSQSVYSLYNNKDNINSVFDRERKKHIESTIGSRIAIEICLCDCPETGRIASGIDISKIITYAKQLYEVGNSSDAINYDLFDPVINISSFGEVIIENSKSMNSIVHYSSEVRDRMLKKFKKEYNELYKSLDDNSVLIDKVGDTFKNAWLSEFGISLKMTDSIVVAIQNYGISKANDVLELSYDSFFKICNAADIENDQAEAFLNSFILPEREKWDDTLQYDTKEIFPWKYRRKLSFLSKPVLKLEDKLIIAPHSLSEGVYYVINNSINGNFDDSYFSSNEMKKWVGHINNYKGSIFNETVAQQYKSFDWEAKHDLEITEIFQQSLDKNYGDIDVLAWSVKNKQILLIECKDLQFSKTLGELSKQMSEFKGQYDDSKKPDRLQKHINRVDLICKSREKLCQFCDMPNDTQILPCVLFNGIAALKHFQTEALDGIHVLSYDDISSDCLT